MTTRPKAKSGAPGVIPTLVDRIYAGAAWVSVLMLWACAASVYVPPSWCGYVGIFGLAFPFFLGGTLCMLAAGILFSPRQAWIPLVGMALSFGSIRTYVPFNLTSEAPRGSIKVMTYNVMGWGNASNYEDDRNRTMRYVAQERPDIFCYQEGYAARDIYDRYIVPEIREHCPYLDTLRIGENVLGCFSRFPIVGKEHLCGSATNGAVAFKLLSERGDTLLVVNCHLESMHLSRSEREGYSRLVHRGKEAERDTLSRQLAAKIAFHTKLRGHQADTVAAYVKRHAGWPVIVCGDFNDSPISYARYTVGRGLTDAFRASGNGMGRSFNRDAIVVRIDHMFCSSHWKPYGCRVDQTADYSDHYPLITYLHRMR